MTLDFLILLCDSSQNLRSILRPPVGLMCGRQRPAAPGSIWKNVVRTGSSPGVVVDRKQRSAIIPLHYCYFKAANSSPNGR
jgi:hypothetical protein